MPYAEIEKSDGVAVVWLDQPGEKVNTISPGLISDFEKLLDELERDDEVRAFVFISRKEDNFIAGGDIEAFLKLEGAGEAEAFIRRAQALLNRLEGFSKPAVAAIHGSAMGGGLELAMACAGRVADTDPKTVMAQPEVRLGLLPAGGGTQRLPRLVGLQKALDFLLTGKNIYPGQARKLGLIDYLVNPHALLRTARAFALDLARERKERKPKLPLWAVPLEKTPVGRGVVYKKARDMVRKMTMGNYPAPLRIIDCVETGLEKGMKAGLDAEARSFAALVGSPEGKQLMNIFFAMTALKKNPKKDRAREVKAVGILGAGFMGAGIAQVSAERDMDVLLKDVSQDAIGSCEKTVWGELSRKVKKRAITPFRRDTVMTHIVSGTTYEGFDRADIVIEAVFEDLELKRRIVAETEAAVGDACIFASNTSALPISDIAAGAKRPERILGMHYFSPVPKMPLLEIIVTDKTADWAEATALELGIRQGKTVIVVKDGPGFYTTRILAPLLHEALLLLEEGADAMQIDRAMKKFGYPVGPVKLLDEVGIDVGAHVTRGVLGKLFEDKGVTPTDALIKLDSAGFKGRKSKKGFYVYEEKKIRIPLMGRKKREINKEVYRFFGGEKRKPFEDSVISGRLSLLMVNEAVRCLEDGIIREPRDGDIGAIFGLGFPPFRGGPFRYVDATGAGTILSMMEGFQRTCGRRFEPASLLREHSKKEKRFYPR